MSIHRRPAFAIAFLVLSVSLPMLLPMSAANAAEPCLSAPKGAAPQGNWWKYRIDRTTQRKCWRLVKLDQQPSRATTQMDSPPEGDDDTDSEVVTAPPAKPAERMVEAVPQRVPEWTSHSASAIAPETTAAVNSANAAERLAERADAPGPAPSAPPAPALAQEPVSASVAEPLAASAAAEPSSQPNVAAPKAAATPAASGPGMIQFVFVAIGLGLLAAAIFILLGVRRRSSDVLTRLAREDEHSLELPEAADAPTFSALPPMRLDHGREDSFQAPRRSPVRTRLAG